MHYLAMEYVEGKDLATVVKERGPLPVQQAVECILQAARGLQYAHGKGIVHRDIKPGNLLLDNEGTVKILDMGLALIAGSEAALGGAERLTTTGQVMGTCDYMAPEQSLDTHQADARADIYSLGCTLYRLLTGHPPYQGETFAKLFLMHLESPIPSLCAARPEVSRSLDAVYQRMLAKKPEDRYQSMAEVIGELEAVLGVSSGHSTPVGPPPPPPPPPLGVPSGRWTAAAAESPSESVSKKWAFLREVTQRGTPTWQKRPTAPEPAQPYVPVGNALRGVPGRAPGAASSDGPQRHAARSLQAKLRRAVASIRRRPLLLLSIGVGLVALLAFVLALTTSRTHDTAQPSDGSTAPRANAESQIPNLKSEIPSPPPAVAPFDAKKARKHQEAWAKHLGVPVEIANSIGMKLVLIPPGEFMMGSPKELIEEELKARGDNPWFKERLPAEGPQHRVRITKPFYLGKYLVTQEEYQRVMGVNPSEFSAAGGHKDQLAGQETKRFPVEGVSWDDAVGFCRKLSETPEERAAGRTYGLPSEAQWEYACRAGSTGRYSFSSGREGTAKEYEEHELADYGWSNDNAGGMPHAVGLKRASAWGLYDMHGNMWEWCQDWYDKGYYASAPTDDPQGPIGGSVRVHRGGTWDSPACFFRSAFRDYYGPGSCCSNLGFRVCRVLADKPGGPTAQPVDAIRAGSESKIADLRSEIPARPLAAAPVATSSPQQTPPPPKAPGPEPKPTEPNPGPASSPAVRPVPASSPQQPPPAPQQPPPPKSETPPTLTAPKQKLPVPDDAAQAQARKDADALFKTEIQQAKTSADKVALAKRLLAQALDQPRDTAGQYVLMLGAKDLAATAGDAQTAFQVVDQMAGVFEVDRFAMKTEMLKDWAKEARTPEARRWAVEQMLAVGDEAVDAGSLEAAKELGTLATSKSGGLRDKNLTLELKAYRQRLTEAGQEIEELQEARAALAKDPKDPKASLVLGQYLCFSKGDWEEGLSLLAQGSDASLKGLAERELTSPPKQPEEQVNLGDAWWEIASTRGRLQTSAIKMHAGRWYREADAGLAASPVKYNVEKRLAEVRKLRSQSPSPPGAIAPFDEKKAKEHQQRWAQYLSVPVEMTNSIGMKLVLIPPGEFMMGSPKELIEEGLKSDEKDDRFAGELPQHRVRITKPYYLGTYLVMQEEYQRVMGANPSEFSATGKSKGAVAGKDTKRFPVECVSWDDAVEFCRKLSEMPEEKAAGRWYRLPSEAQWEYACRAGSTGRYSFSLGGSGISKESEERKLSDYGWSKNNWGGATRAVGLKRASAWGLYDMHGNVFEWCEDRYDKEYYAKSPLDDPTGPLGGARGE